MAARLFMVCLAICFTLLSSTEVSAEPLLPVQIFDVKQNKVVQTMPNSDEIRQEVQKWVAAIHDSPLSPALSLDPKAGIVLRIPIHPEMKVQSQHVHESITEVLLFLNPEWKKPRIMFLSKEYKPYIFDLDYDVQPFLKRHNIKAKP